MEPLVGGPTSPFRSNTTPMPPDSQQHRELSDFSFYKSVNAADCKALHSTYRRGKRNAEASKLKNLQTQDSFKRDALRTIIRQSMLQLLLPLRMHCAALSDCMRVRFWIFRFLTFSDFPGPLSAKALSSPQRSLLIDIWSHLFRRCFDDSVKLTTENVNDEVPRLFKEIGYPFPISKSAMLAPGTGHQWPHHLAALSWLCELLIYENEFFHQEEEANELQGRSDFVGRLMTVAYAQNGKDAQAVKSTVLGQLHAMHADAEAAHQQLQQQLQQRQQQLASVEAELRDNASLMKTIEELTQRESSIRANIAEAKAEIAQQESRSAAAAAERDALLQQQKELQREINQLEDRVKAQGIDKAELERIRHDITRLREGLAHRTKARLLLLHACKRSLLLMNACVHGRQQKRLRARCQVNENIGCMVQMAASVKLASAEGWASLPKMSTSFAAAAADSAAAAAAAADVKRATNEILGVDWPALKTELLRLMKTEEEAEAETNQQRHRAEKEIERLRKAIKDLIASRKTLEKRMQLVQEDLQQQQQQQQAEVQQLEEAERQQLEGIREAKQQHQQEQQQLQRRVQQQQQQLQQEDRQQQQQAASGLEALQQHQREALQQKRQLLQQLQLLAETNHAACIAVERQLLELTEALTPSPRTQPQERSSFEAS
ncbi:hypothetical protein Efla_000861 [Eimeria flavescens]